MEYSSSFCAIYGIVLMFAFVTTINADLTGLRFWLYTKSNKYLPVELKSSDVTTINNSKFVANKPTKFLCHGYTSSYLAAFPQYMKNNYLGLSDTYNVIAVDWAQLSAITVPYNTAAQNTRAVGKEIANLIQQLISSGKSQLSDFHFLGHSLGGQVGAFISNNLQGGQKVPRVTGLDPARPGFDPTSTPTSERLDPSDAGLVDVIRTSTGVNSGKTVADPPGTGAVDFYPNGGVMQLGCNTGDDLCSHNRAYEYFAESIINNKFISYKCANYTDFKASCPKTAPAFMGEFVSQSVTGTYYLDTKSTSPYAMG